MEGLTIKELAPYLPYGLKLKVYGQTIWEDYVANMEQLLYSEDAGGGEVFFSHEWNTISNNSEYFKPILRPLSDLTKEIEVNGERFVPVGKLETIFSTYDESFDPSPLIEDSRWLNQMPYGLIEQLHEWHFDTKGLIEKGLAIDINTIKQTR